MSDSSTGSRCPIVAIGASAGGLDPLRELVGAIPRDAGVAWVVVQHLSADHETTLHTLLGACTVLPVDLLQDGDAVSGDRIGVAPPGFSLNIDEERYRLEPLRKSGVRTPIDQCFSAVARERADAAFCVVLSGTGSDGTEGLKTIKCAGGVTFAQTAAAARFPGMPDSARATGMVDFTLEARAIPARILEILAFRERTDGDRSLAKLRASIEQALPAVLDVLRHDGEGRDFTNYKPGTLVRRIDRRMMLTHHRSIEGYLDTLEDDEHERLRLGEDFLIGVTRFFRDREAFDTLREHWIEPTLSLHDGMDELRIWVAGCSTGEEVYSIAILVHEAMREAGVKRSVQLFGTDIDEAAVYRARQGIFTTSALADLDPDTRKRYFVPWRDGLRANTTLRESCVFALHDVLTDPPFSRVDLISCRNLLIYLNRIAQGSIMSRFHYALHPGGALFLGSAEAADAERGLFDTVHRQHRLYRRNDAASSNYSALSEPLRTPRHGVDRRRTAAAERLASGTADLPIDRRAERFYLERMAPAYATLDAQERITYLSPGMTRHVRPAAGAVSLEYTALLHESLQTPCKRVIDEARRTNAAASLDTRVLDPDALVPGNAAVGGELMRLQAQPMPLGPGLPNGLMLTFQPLESPSDAIAAATEDGADASALRSELLRTRRDLDATLSDFESSSQELKSTNEELLSMNLEMQSTNEELETSREELQSINEELQTMNAELNENNGQLRRANDDLKNLFEAGELATLFLDRHLRVRSFTPQLTRLFGIHERDGGRPLADLTRRFEHDALEADAAHVFRTLEIVEREIGSQVSGDTWILRIRPYRTVDDRLDGVVMSFFDISERKRQEVQLRENESNLARQYAELETLYDTTPVGLSLVNRELRWLRINEQLAAINGFAPAEHIGKRQDELIPDIDKSIAAAQQQVIDTGEAVLGMAVSGTTPAEPDVLRDWIADFYPVIEDGEVFAVGACVREVTEQKAMEAALRHNEQQARLLLAELQHRVKNTLATIIAIVRMMSRTVGSVDEMREDLSNRLHALSRTHDLLTETRWNATSMRQLVDAEVQPLCASPNEQISYVGPEIALRPRAALAIGMAIHELATNSLKHGALGSSDGRVRIRTARKDNELTLEWTESDVQRTESPGDAGFGRYLLERALPEQLEGTSRLVFNADGMSFRIAFPAEPIELRRFVAQDASPPLEPLP